MGGDGKGLYTTHQHADSMFGRSGAVACLLIVLVATPGVAGALAGDGGAARRGQMVSPLAATQVSPDDVFLGIDVRSDGDAAWRVEYRVRLESDNETAAFRSIQRDVRNNSSAFAAPFARRMRATAADAENATGREMAVENVTVTATIEQLPQEYGVITYRFVWTNFAARDGDRLVVGDAVSGLFLDDRTTLSIAWPGAYDATSVTPAADERRASAAVWIGPTTFEADEPRLVVAPAEETTAVTEGRADPDGGDGRGATDSTTPAAGTFGSRVPWIPLIGLVVVALAGVVGLRIWTSGGIGGGPAARTGGNDADGPDAAADDPAAAPATGDDAGADDAGPTSADEDAGDAAPPEELLSNEERVLKLISERGGRMKQQEVAEALDWTDAKTSQVVRQMRDDGDLDAFRLGRENVLTLPDHDVVGDEG